RHQLIRPRSTHHPPRPSRAILFPYTTLFRSLTEDEYRRAREQYGDSFEAGMGAEAVKKLLEHLNLVDLSRQLRADLHTLSQKERSEEHTSELQSQSNLVCRLLLEKKKIEQIP